MGGEVIELAHWVEDATIKEDWGRTRPLQENPRLCMEGPPPQALQTSSCWRPPTKRDGGRYP